MDELDERMRMEIKRRVQRGMSLALYGEVFVRASDGTVLDPRTVQRNEDGSFTSIGDEGFKEMPI